MNLLAIETSCDETAAAVLDAGGTVLSNIVSSQQAVHERFGGVVPELASRAHVEKIEQTAGLAMNEARMIWKDLAAVAVTQGPGLAGALIVGLNYAKALGYALGIPVATSLNAKELIPAVHPLSVGVVILTFAHLIAVVPRQRGDVSAVEARGRIS